MLSDSAIDISLFLSSSLVREQNNFHEFTADREPETDWLAHHPIYSKLTSIAKIECFVSYHIFAVWDSLRLLKSLQDKLDVALKTGEVTCSNQTRILLDKVVFNQESELYPYGQPTNDFAEYISAVAELEIDPDLYLWYFIDAKSNFHLLKPEIKELIEFNSAVAQSGTMAEIAATFFLNKERLSLGLFTSMKQVFLQKEEESSILNKYIQKLIHKHERPFELKQIARLFDCLCRDEAEKMQALRIANEAFQLKENLWNGFLLEVNEID